MRTPSAGPTICMSNATGIICFGWLGSGRRYCLVCSAIISLSLKVFSYSSTFIMVVETCDLLQNPPSMIVVKLIREKKFAVKKKKKFKLCLLMIIW